MPNRFEIKKKFEILPLTHHPSWLQQQDATSCGYHLIHNAQPYIHIQHYEGSPEGIFKTMNVLRKYHKEKRLSRDSFLPSPDLARYFFHKKFAVTSLSNPQLDEQVLRRIVSEQSFDLLYMTTHAHYTGIVPHNGQLLFLDSLTNGPTHISIPDALNRSLESLGQEQNSRYNIVGIIKKK